MIGQFLLALFAFSAAPGAEPLPAPKAATEAPSSTGKPCDPVEPEAGADGNPIFTGCQIKALGGVLPKLLSAPEEPDVSKLYRQGIQGEIFFRIIIGQDGIPRDIVTKQSSRSPELDAIGLEVVKRTTFTPATDQTGKAVDVRAIYPIYFWKDSFSKNEFTKKTCDQFLIDTAWHEANFPEKRPDQYRGWLLAKGMFFAASMKSGRDRKTPTYDETLEICRKNPRKPFLGVLAGQ